MARKGGARLRALDRLVARAHPDIDAAEAIRSGSVLVDGRVVSNPASLVRRDASIALRRDRPLRGEAKLRFALRAFGVSARGRVALDLGAAAGGFTRVLLENGAARVYAVDAGHGQLLGSLRQHPGVVDLERTNIGELGPELVPESVEIVTVDLSYVSLARAVPQLEGRVAIAADADLVALVKPQFELGVGEPPVGAMRLAQAIERASDGIERAGWTVAGVVESPVPGSRGAVEFLLHARRGQAASRRASSASRDAGRRA